MFPRASWKSQRVLYIVNGDASRTVDRVTSNVVNAIDHAIRVRKAANCLTVARRLNIYWSSTESINGILTESFDDGSWCQYYVKHVQYRRGDRERDSVFRGCEVRVFGTGSVENHSEPPDREFSWKTTRENGSSVEWATRTSEGRGYYYLPLVFLFSATHRSVSNTCVYHSQSFSRIVDVSWLNGAFLSLMFPHIISLLWHFSYSIFTSYHYLFLILFPSIFLI